MRARALALIVLDVAMTASGCRKEASLDLGAEAADLVIVSRLDEAGSVVETRLAPGARELIGFEDDQDVVAFVVAAADLVRFDGAPLPEDWRSGARAHFDQASTLDAPACHRCLGPTDPAPWPVYPGESCAVPDSARAASWPNADDATAIEAARASTFLEWPGECVWSSLEPARCVPSPPGTFGQRRDCRVDYGPSDAWPDRAPEPEPLSRQEVAEACAILGACGVVPGDAATIVARCTSINADEQFAIPLGSTSLELFAPSDVRWSYFVRTAIRELAATGDCARARSLLVPRPERLACGSEGCIWRGLDRPRVTCTASVATLVTDEATYRRDCSAVLARCDPGSPTGCTDRTTHLCDPSAKNRDRCVGPIKLGCSGLGLVSFEDCSRYEGGACLPTADDLGAYCGYSVGTECASGDQSCDGDTLAVCIQGTRVRVDCAAIGLGACSGRACLPP